MWVASSSCWENLGFSVMAEQTSVGLDRAEHFVLRAVDHRDEGEHVLGVGQLVLGARAVQHGRPQVVAAFLFHQPRAAAVFLGDFRRARLLEGLLRSGR